MGDSSSSSEDVGGGGGGGGGGGTSGGTESEEQDMGRLQAMLEARGFPPHLAGVLGPRMHHFMLNRGGGGTSSSASAKAHGLLGGLQATGDESRQLQAVIEMCQLLVMGNEDTLSGFPIRQIVPALIALLKMEHNFDLMNNACRALTYMMEALPRSSSVIVDAIPTFLEKLQVIQCMDVAEQSLTALEMLSKKHNKAILHAKGVSSCLTYLDFFSIGAQRNALAITSNCCQNLLPEEFVHIRDSLDILSSRLIHDDKKSAEMACLALSRLAESYKNDKNKLKEIATPEVIYNLQRILVSDPPIVSPNTFVTVLHILVVMSSHGSEVGLLLLRQKIGSTLRQLLINDEMELLSRNPQELYEITSLIAELMPPLPADGIFAVDALLTRPGAYIRDPVLWQWQDDRGIWHTYGYNDCRVIEAAHVAGEEEVTLASNGNTFVLNLNSMHEIKEESGTARPIQRKFTSQLQNEHESDQVIATKLKIEHLDLTSDLTRQLFPVLLDVYSTSAGPGVRHSCIQAKLRMIVHAPTELLSEVLSISTVSSQVAGMLSSGDLKIIIGALQISEILLQKIPEEFGVHFRREGVLHQVQKLTDPDNPMTLSQGGLENTIVGASAIWTPQSRTWTIAGSSSSSSLPNVFADQLRVPKRRDESSPDITPQSIRLSDVLKRKRASKRPSGSRKGRHSDPSNYDGPSTSSSGHSSTRNNQNLNNSWNNEFQASGSDPPSTPSRRSRLADKTSSLLSQLHPARWGRSTSTSSPTLGSGSTGEAQRKEGIVSNSGYKSVSSPATMAHGREKAKRWVRERATKFLESYFKESLGSRHPALTILRRLSVQVDHLTRKPKDGERSLKEIFSVLHENDISPFEVSQSGLVGSLLKYLTTKQDNTEINHEHRIRTFLYVFFGCPKNPEDSIPDPEIVSRSRKFIQKLNACLNHLEQFPIKMHDMTTGSSGVKSAGSTLRFFKTHHLKCNLQRHPDCTTLKSWKGGLVKIDPLALVQAIERYLISRGYGYHQDKDSGGSDDDEMSDEGADDTLPSTSRGTSSSSTTAGGSSSSTSSDNHRLEFLIGDHKLPYEMTVYQSIQQFGGSPPPQFDPVGDLDMSGNLCGSPSIWARIHTIYYRPASDDGKNKSEPGKKGASGGKGSKQSKRKVIPDELWNEGIPPEHPSPLYTFLVDKLPKITTDPSSDVLCLLRVLHVLNRYWWTLYPNASSVQEIRSMPLIPQQDFINPKLTAKVNRQLQDPIIIMTSNLPNWLKDIASSCPFLFPFETRQLLFYVTSFDRDRALLRLLDSIPELGATDAGQERVTPDLDRKKRVISRDDNLLKQSEQVMNELAPSRSLLEIQYENEVGTGLGPTLEFYTLVSKELQKADLGLWKGETVKISNEDVMDSNEDNERNDKSSCIEYIHSSVGLYPNPMARNVKSSQRSKIKNKFTFLGKFIAKAVLDNRMIDMPFSQPFYQWLLREESTLGISDLRNVDPTIASTISSLEGIARKKRKLEQDPQISPDEKLEQIKSLTMDGCPIEDLGLDFTLPGYPNIDLRKGGKDIPVNIDNLHQYVGLVSHWLLIEGISFQMEALRDGFESVFPISTLQMFYPEELEQIFCGTGQGNFNKWDYKTLVESTKPDHGFNSESPALKYLLEVLESYNIDEQRQFLQFVTGCPRLPVGGFKALNPPLTIVKKSFDNADADPDDYLPSVMTCVNYLKLPDYSSKKIMREKLRIAAMEGQYCFHLS
ncbi:E3 ubiquitin-protein ligase TRIP12 [Lepeophtheirus salmonis]|uniref:E3 ubiquitin-protein ligase n=1 Tax=Lepeophtheirus salmonis TaxID=72036 RepID=A0A0K2U086_LEPSM|nr:E3 ubiquitin-protein ligase TRIP12-like [Lepeophtheirus salmonis]